MLVTLNIKKGAVEDQPVGRRLYSERRFDQRDRRQGSNVYQLSDGRWVDVSERPAPENRIVCIHQDITKQRQTEIDLQRSDELINDAISSLQDGFVLFDRDENLVTSNAVYRDMFPHTRKIIKPGVNFERLLDVAIQHGHHERQGLSADDFRKQRIDAFRNPSTEAFQQTLEDGRIVLSREIRTKGGSIVGIRTDISELKKTSDDLALAREAAEAAEHQMMDAIENISEGFSLYDSEDRIILCNSKFRDLYGYSEKDAAPGTPVKRLLEMDLERGIIAPGTMGLDALHLRTDDFGEADNTIEMPLADGRWVQIRDRETAGGGTVSIHADISDRKRAEQEMADKEDQLRVILDNLPGGVRYVDKNKKYIFFNSQYSNLYDFPGDLIKIGESNRVENLYQANRGDFGPGDPEELVEKWLSEFPVDAKPQRWERTTVLGKTLQVDTAPDPSGGVVNIVTDITQQQKAAKEIERQKGIIETVLESVGQGISMFDENLDLTTCNAQYASLLDFPIELCLPGTPLAAFFRYNAARGEYGAGDVEEQVAHRIELAKTFEPHVFERVRGDGTVLEVSGYPVSTGGFVTTYTDITERKKAERKILENEQKLKRIFATANEGIWMADNERLTTEVNEAMCKILGLENDEIVGRPIFDFVDADNKEIFLEQSRRRMRGESGIYEVELSRPDGTRVPCLINATAMMDGAGAQIGSFAMVTDIAERKAAEQELRTFYDLVSSSINYASRIQRSLLPDTNQLKNCFADHFVIWEPKDVVGGDIYFHRKCEGGQLLILLDCTGHGVPGAFMTMIAAGALDQALMEVPSGDPAALLSQINKVVKLILGQEGDEGESDDGFECGVCLIPASSNEIVFAGARFEIWHLDGQEITVTKSDKVGIGYRRTKLHQDFTNHILPVTNGTRFYMTTDGLIDQIGGKKHRAYGKRRLKSIILDYSRMNMATQAAHILRSFEEYQHDEERRDDISLVGFKLHLN